MAVMTLLEAMKYGGFTDLRNGVIATFAMSPILQFLPFRDIDGNAYQWNEEKTLPGVGFRNVNEEYTPDIGIVNPRSENLRIGGGLIKIDRSLINTQSGKGTSILAEQINMKTKAMSLRFAKAFVKGDSESSPEEFDGLENRLPVDGGQVLDAGSTSGGNELSLDLLDALIDLVDPEPTALIMSKTMRRKVNKLIRAAGQSHETVNGAFGTRLDAYAGFPILTADYDNEGNQILPFTEENPGGGTAASTSIYAVRFGPDAVTGIQNGIIQVEDQGTQGIYRQILVEWYVSIIAAGPRCAARLRGIKNA